MAETLISPGVLARENDQSFITQNPVTVGASLIGPTVKGQVEIPTIVTSYSDYIQKFGSTFTSASQVYTYFTSIAAFNYFANGGDTLLVSRVVSGTFNPATTTDAPSSASTATIANTAIISNVLNTTASATLNMTNLYNSVVSVGSASFNLNGVNITLTSSVPPYTNTVNTIFISGSTSAANAATSASIAINASSSATTYSTFLQYITSSTSTITLNLFSTTGVTGIAGNSYYYISGSTTTNFTGGTNKVPLVLETLSEGIIMNSSSSLDSAGALASGSSDNIRWQIVNTNTGSGTFDLLVRRGNDNTLNPNVLETWTNLSLDPFAPNYVAKVLGDYTQNYNASTNQIEISGSYPNRSAYVRVKSVLLPTPNYFSNAGVAQTFYTASLPLSFSGSFGYATGNLFTNGQTAFYNQITAATPGNYVQGIPSASYNNMIALMSNSDDYKFNVLLAPGLFNNLQTSQITSIINNTQNRGDNIFVLDLVAYDGLISDAVAQAATRNTSYAASYWPWVQTQDPDSGQNVWVPASTMIGGVYAYNDTVAEPWFAPAGINRGGLTTVIRAAQKLSQSNRDTLYTGKVNPIATFPGTGVVVYGQKTLQTASSALDRVNVRRLLIALKSYISQVAQNLVFEQNSIATRNQFLSQVNPYLESVQQRQGLYAFRVIMDDSNNTPDVIDRNELIGQIYIQPTKTAEFIYLDFNILPTGATFPG